MLENFQEVARYDLSNRLVPVRQLVLHSSRSSFLPMAFSFPSPKQSDC